MRMTGQSESESETCGDGKKRVETSTQYVCSYDECRAVFKRSDRLETHLRVHYGERPFVCPLSGCERSFTCRSYLNKHMKRPHNSDNGCVADKVLKQYACNECPKQFKSKFQLRLHSYQHTGEMPFKCDECDKCFATRSKLKSHSKTHDGYRCGRSECDFVCFKWTQLRKHVASHHKQCHRCDICDKKFTNNYNLKLHKEATHSSNKEKSVSCPYDDCDKTYFRKSSLSAHIRVAHQHKQFACTYEGCDKTFLHKKSFKEHVDNHSKPKPEKAFEAKKVRRRVCLASKLTLVEPMTQEVNEIMTNDLMFRKEDKIN